MLAPFTRMLSAIHIYLDAKSSINHTWYLSFFLHGQHFGRTLSPHRKCVNCDKTGFATKQRKLQQNRFCKKTVEKRSHIKIILSIYLTWYARANNSWNQTNFSTSKMSPHVKFLHIQNFSTSKMSPHLEFLHMTRKFSTDNVRGVRDKYQVCNQTRSHLMASCWLVWKPGTCCAWRNSSELRASLLNW